MHFYQIVQNSLYLSLLAPKNLHPLLFRLACCTQLHMLHSYIRLLVRTSSNSPTLPVIESTFQVPTLNAQPSRSLSSCSQQCALTQCCVAFQPGFTHLFLRRHVGAPIGWYPTSLFELAILLGLTGAIGDPIACQLIWVSSASSPIITPIYAGCPTCYNPPNLSWLNWDRHRICWLAFLDNVKCWIFNCLK